MFSWAWKKFGEVSMLWGLPPGPPTSPCKFPKYCKFPKIFGNLHYMTVYVVLQCFFSGTRLQMSTHALPHSFLFFCFSCGGHNASGMGCSVHRSRLFHDMKHDIFIVHVSKHGRLLGAGWDACASRMEPKFAGEVFPRWVWKP